MSPDILEEFDTVIKDSAVDILNISLSEFSYKQLTLPIAKGGMGLRLAKELAISGYVSSVCATENAVISLLPENIQNVENHYRMSALNMWKQISTQNTEPENPKY